MKHTLDCLVCGHCGLATRNDDNDKIFDDLCDFGILVCTMTKKKIILISITMLAIVAGGVFINKTGLMTGGQGEIVGDVTDFDRSAKTLERLGFLSTEDLSTLSDSSEAQDNYVRSLKDMFSLLDDAEIEEDVVDASVGIGLYLDILGQKDKAIAQYEYLISVRPNYSVALGNLAWIYVEHKEYEKAEYYYDRLIEEYSSASKWYIRLADVYRTEEIDKKDQVRPLIERGLENLPKSTILMFYLARFYEEEKEYELAIEWYEKVLAVNSDDGSARSAIDFIEKKLNK